MNCDDIKLMISEYLDGELVKEKEAFLFTHLSACGDCREEFKIQNSIQHQTKTNMKEVTESFEQKLSAGIEKKEKSLGLGSKIFSIKTINAQRLFGLKIVLSVSVLCILLMTYFLSNNSRQQNHIHVSGSNTKEIEEHVELVFEYGFEKRISEIEQQMRSIIN